jgi:hypothetical protein
MSSSTERKVQGYLKPVLHKFIMQYSQVYEVSESQAVNQAVKALHDTIPADIRERIMKAGTKNGY